MEKNISSAERKATVIIGASLLAFGLGRRTKLGWLAAAGGAALTARGASGYCPAYQKMGMNYADASQNKSHFPPGAHGVSVRDSVTINRTPEELYSFWRKLSNLPEFMIHVLSVEETSERLSRWNVKAPLGRTVSWEAEIINDIPNRLIAWQSLPESQIYAAGSVRFEPTLSNRGCEVRLNMEYNPPAGVLGMSLAKILGEEPSIQAAEDLRRFKSLMEAGETPTTEGQPVGTRSLKGRALEHLQKSHSI